MTFVPLRRSKAPRSKAELDREAELVRITERVSLLLREEVIAMDTFPKLGAIAFRDSHGQVWCLKLEKSDVDRLVGEADLARRVKP